MLWNGKLPLTVFEVPRVLSRKQHRKWNRKNKRMLGRSIEERPAIVDEHEELGHWEADTVVGQRQGKEAVVFTMVERITNHYIAIKIPGRNSTSVRQAMSQLHVYLTVFDQRQIGAGDTVYQIVNQIERPAKIIGKPNRRFDTTLLINGLPILQIEEKRDTHERELAHLQTQKKALLQQMFV